ncbi:hypothetical protein [Streptomyces sparsogenes]|uniref:Uncharacterized protein n=1 Tax=Streptomyces sparsogenes DSM 40356 TaxID=1331668 RepID=A0A1R1S801_9ACTN|nr:hypothetical protein [Streptomyces sparsogenes]OMI34461.1 hypothetical protein SPAR_36796 [Streptomyces sparsogenes DSM 40356]
MKVTINAHQLGRLIDKTISHMADDSIEPLHGIRLDLDSTHLYAIASDRYTLAVARYELLYADKGAEPYARTIPGEYLRPLREWISTQIGHASITISTDEDRLVFAAPLTEFRIATKPDIKYPDWRGLLRTIAEQTTEEAPFPALHSGFLARWADTGSTIRVRVTADQKAVLVFAEDFIGAQMPARYAGVGPVKDETIDSARALWKDVLHAGTSRADMVTDMPDADRDRSRYEATTDVRETGEDLLHQALRSTWQMYGADMDTEEGRAAFNAWVSSGVRSWMAYRFLDALYQVDPRAAEGIVGETADQLDSGEIGEWAWDEAKKAGHDPQKWYDDYKAHLEKLAAKRQAQEQVEKWERLAMAFNAATQAGVKFRVEPNPHVQWDANNNRWIAVEATTAEAAA